MRFSETTLPGAMVVDLDRFDDHRGSFLRSWCRREFAAHGLETDFVQGNISINPRKGTLRGMHYQLPPHDEVKLVRCVRGAILDVIVDLRPGSPTWREWVGVELTAEAWRMLYIPEGFAHGFQTLTDDVEVTYQVSNYYEPGAARGIRYDDPAIGIVWPAPVGPISTADATWPLLTESGPSGLPAFEARRRNGLQSASHVAQGE